MFGDALYQLLTAMDQTPRFVTCVTDKNVVPTIRKEFFYVEGWEALRDLYAQYKRPRTIQQLQRAYPRAGRFQTIGTHIWLHIQRIT